MSWYSIKNVSEIDTPSLVIHKDRVLRNIEKMIMMAGSVERLIPHIKTHKMMEVIQMMKDKGITQCKCATIAEAELAAMSGMNFVLIAHQLVGPKIDRFFALIKQYPNTQFASLLDDIHIAHQFQERAEKANLKISVFLDVNNGMNRSGFPIQSEIFDFFQQIYNLSNIKVEGLHIYDGHYRQSDFEQRKAELDQDFLLVEALILRLQNEGHHQLKYIAGGSPAFSVHLDKTNILLSPGTSVFWDWGYSQKCPEQDFEIAGVVLCRIISKPTPGIITVDLGHKAIAPENPIDKRVQFLNIQDYTLVSQSEEHGVIQVSDWDKWNVGDVLYGLPYHICPTVNLQSEVFVIEENKWTDTWNVLARQRRINV